MRSDFFCHSEGAEATEESQYEMLRFAQHDKKM